MINPKLPCVLCIRLDETRPGIVLPPGVEEGRCVGCDGAIYTSSSSREQVARGEAQPVCTQCGVRYYRGRAVVVATTSEARKELESWNRPK